MAKIRPPRPLALPKIDLEEKSLEVRLRLKGKAAVDLADYQRAYQALNGGPIEAEPLSNHSRGLHRGRPRLPGLAQGQPARVGQLGAIRPVTHQMWCIAQAQESPNERQDIGQYPAVGADIAAAQTHPTSQTAESRVQAREAACFGDAAMT